jgi:hypothetical protein
MTARQMPLVRALESEMTTSTCANSHIPFSSSARVQLGKQDHMP